MYRFKSLFLASTIIIVVFLTACSSSKGPVKVEVTLDDYKITSSLTEFKSNVPYEFVVTNQSQVNNHEFMIMPVMQAGSNMSMEEMDKMAVAMIPEDQLPPGASKTIEVTFSQPADNLEFACHVTGHYDQGMKQSILVK